MKMNMEHRLTCVTATVIDNTVSALINSKSLRNLRYCFKNISYTDAVKKGVHCGNIIREITAICGGRGGGKPDMAQGGGTDALKINDALAKVDDIVKAQVNA